MGGGHDTDTGHGKIKKDTGTQQEIFYYYYI